MSDTIEMWDIYDKDKKLTGRKMKKNDWVLKDDEYHLTVLGVVRHKSEGKYLITKRVMTKAWAPGWWEVSGGACQAGETSIEAVRREVNEETGLDTKDKGEYIFTYHRENSGKGDNYFVDVYRFDMDFTDADLNIQEAEAAGYMLATVEEIEAFAKEGIFLHYDSIKRVFE